MRGCEALLCRLATCPDLRSLGPLFPIQLWPTAFSVADAHTLLYGAAALASLACNRWRIWTEAETTLSGLTGLYMCGRPHLAAGPRECFTCRGTGEGEPRTDGQIAPMRMCGRFLEQLNTMSSRRLAPCSRPRHPLLVKRPLLCCCLHRRCRHRRRRRRRRRCRHRRRPRRRRRRPSKSP